MDSPSYRSFLVRLWREPSAAGAWHGEVESIQSGQILPVETLDDVLVLIRQAVGTSQPPALPASESDRASPRDGGANL